MSHPLLPATRGRRPWGLRPWSATVGASGHAMHHRMLAVSPVLSARTHERTYVLVRAFGKGASAGPLHFPRVRRLFWHRVRRTSYWPTSQVKSVLLVPGPRSLDGRRREIWDASGLRAHLRYLRMYVRCDVCTDVRMYKSRAEKSSVTKWVPAPGRGHTSNKLSILILR